MVARPDDSERDVEARPARSTTPGKRRPGAGRKRDSAIDGRILTGAREVYAREGWAGFTVDAVAKSAGVSRDAINRRHADAQTLLYDAVTAGSMPILDWPDNGDPHQIVTEYALALFDWFSVGEGPLLLRIHLEARNFPEVFRVYRDEFLASRQRLFDEALRELFNRSAPNIADVDPAVVRDSITGSVMMHALSNQSTGPDDVERSTSARNAIKSHVDLILAAIGAPSAARRP